MNPENESNRVALLESGPHRLLFIVFMKEHQRQNQKLLKEYDNLFFYNLVILLFTDFK